MVILHIATITDDICNGVNVVVPQHVEYQGRFAETALLNTRNYRVENGIRQYKYEKGLKITSLPEPFNCPDVVVFHEVYTPEYLIIAKELLERNIPYIIIPHAELTVGAQKKKRLKKMLANVLLFNHFFYNAAALQCLSQNELDTTKYRINMFVGTNGVDLQNQTKTGFRETGRRFTYIGRLDAYHKGLDIMIEAVARCAKDLRRTKSAFALYGPDVLGRYDNVLKIITENGVSDLVTLNRSIVGEYKRKELLDTDVFIQTSRFEGMPLGILEALSFGIPCLITEGTTLASCVKSNDAGWTSETSVDGVAEKILEAISSDELPTRSENAVKIIKEQFAWNVISETTVDAYRAICEKKRVEV